jgi:hypothetical protein
MPHPSSSANSTTTFPTSTNSSIAIGLGAPAAYFGDRDRSFRLKVTGHFGAS